MENNVIGIIQARSNSKRFPEKVYKGLHNKIMIDWVLERTKKSKLLNKVVLTIPYKDKLRNVCYLNYFYEGNENNVLYRIYRASIHFNATHVVRICADNPLIDPNEIDKLITFYFKNQHCDYAYNHCSMYSGDNLYPDGFGAEIVSFKLLHYLMLKVKDKNHEEHCFNYIWDNKDKFVIKTFDPDSDILKQGKDLRFDVNTKEDLDYLNSKKYNIDSTSEEIVKLFLGEK